MRNKFWSIAVALATVAGLMASSPGTILAEPDKNSATTSQAEGSAAETSVLQCASSVPIYRVLTNGRMHLYHHLDPEAGTQSWDPNWPQISNGWHTGRPVAAPDGVFYGAWNTGELRRYRWTGAAWETFNGAASETIDATGWAHYNTADYRNRITVDSEGHIYTVEPDGNLHWRSYDHATRTMTHRVIATGWSQFNHIVAAGRGVLYARTPAGTLYRYRYHAASQRLVYNKQVGTGWQIFDRMFSAGGDIIYAIKPSGAMHWYRFNEDTDTWAANSGRWMSGGWADWATMALPTTCNRVGTSVPQRPSVPAQPRGAVTLLQTANTQIHYTYVDPEGRAIHAAVTDISGQTPNGLAAVPGFTGATATTSTAEHQNGRVQLVAHGTDSELRADNQTTAGGSWAGTTSFGGFMATPASVVRLSNNTLSLFALDADHGLWARRQAAVNGPIALWMPIGATPLAKERLTLVPTATGVRLIVLGSDGRFHTATYENNTLSGWTSLGGGTFTGVASAVVMPDNTLQLFATDTVGTVHTQRQTAAGFPATWTPIPGLTASGNPSAIMSPEGTLQIVARGTDGYVHYAAQAAPGSGTFNPWRQVTDEQTSTDPTALAVPGHNTWVVAYLNDISAPKLRRYQPTTARSATFAEIPLRWT